MKNRLTGRERKKLVRITIALVAFTAVLITDKCVALDRVIGGGFGWLLPFALYFAVYAYIGYDVIWRAARNIAHGQVFDENFLMCVATVGAFALAIYRGASGLAPDGFDEACAVLLFYQVGEWFQAFATGKSRRSISALMDIRPDYANLERDGKTERVDPSEATIGDIIVVNPGERVPLDGVIESGATSLDTKALTGESIPREACEGDEVISGTVNLTSQVRVRVSREFYDSTVSKILELVENASSQKSKTENFITRFARVYTPTVVLIAAMLAVIPSLVTGEWSVWLYRALSFLVVSCPCALVISVPLSFFAGIGAASRYGVLIKGSDYLERLHKANIFVFDKTGTLTKGNFAVTDVYPESARERALYLASIAEKDSSHPIARSIAAAYGGQAQEGYTHTNVAGEGVIARKGDDVIHCGNARLMQNNGIPFEPTEAAGTAVYVAHNGKPIGALTVADEIKPDAATTVKALDGMGCKTVMLTGDGDKIARAVADRVGLSAYKAELLPNDKVAEVEKLIEQKRKTDVLCFVGDGINDAPVLMRSDLGMAMGGVGSDAAIEAADVVLMHDELSAIPLAKRIAKKTMRIVTENIVFSLAVKLAILVLSAFGLADMWLAVFGDVGVAVLAILNAMRVNGKYR